MGNELYNKKLITEDEKFTLIKAAACPLKTLPVKYGADGDYIEQEEMDHPETIKDNYSRLWEQVKKDTINSGISFEKSKSTLTKKPN